MRRALNYLFAMALGAAVLGVFIDYFNKTAEPAYQTKMRLDKALEMKK